LTGRIVKFFALIVATIGALAPVVARGPYAAPDITVTEQEGVYRVRARFEVPQSPGIAIALLKDYERIPKLVPDMRFSIVRERHAERVVVEQEAVAKMMMFSKRVHLLLDIEEESDALRFTDRCGRSFAHYSGQWRVTPIDRGTAVLYELTAKPAFSVPGFVLSRLLKRDALQLIERLRTELAEGPGR
jgi:hypothetical protein